jgi:hypothetical protein
MLGRWRGTIRTARGLPIKLDTTTNGEFAPVPLEPVHHAPRAGMEAATANAKRLGLTRRAFLVSACGAASTLATMNATYAAHGRRGGYYEVDADAALDMQLARSTLDSASSSSTCRAISSTRAAPGRGPARPKASAASRAWSLRRRRGAGQRVPRVRRPGQFIATCSWTRTPTSSCCRSCRRRAKASR